jgi:hypothetical protein
MTVDEQATFSPTEFCMSNFSTLEAYVRAVQSVPLTIVWEVETRPAIAPQAFPVIGGWVGLDGEVGDEGVELDPLPPQASAVVTANAKAATTARVRTVLTHIRKRAFLSDHHCRSVIQPRPAPTLHHECMARRPALQAPTRFDQTPIDVAGLDAQRPGDVT